MSEVRWTARLSSPKFAALLLGLAMALAVSFMALDFRLASSQVVTIQAKATKGPVSLEDPFASVWSQAPPVEVPLSAQMTSFPFGGGAVRAITARALHDGQRLYVLVEWEDATEDLYAEAPQNYRDAAAIQFPAVQKDTVPNFCMGQADGHVNIWQWKADWQADVDVGAAPLAQTYPNAVSDFYPEDQDETFYPGRAVDNPLSETVRTSPVENLMAGGFGTLTHAEVQPVQGVGRWKEGKWRVVFARDLQAEGTGLAQFAPGQGADIAFAVWDGASGERDGQKSVSQFVRVELAIAAGGGETSANAVIAIVVPLVALLVVGSGVGWILYRRQSSARR